MYQHILVPLDGSDLAEQTLPHVKRLAQASLGAQITLLQAVPIDYTPVAEPDVRRVSARAEVAGHEADAKRYLDRLAGTLRGEGYTVQTVVSRYAPASAILDHARTAATDLIVIATHGRHGLRRLVLGSVTEAIIRASPVPVLVIRPKT